VVLAGGYFSGFSMYLQQGRPKFTYAKIDNQRPEPESRRSMETAGANDFILALLGMKDPPAVSHLHSAKIKSAVRLSPSSVSHWLRVQKLSIHSTLNLFSISTSKTAYLFGRL
jgi:hypothetical protein